MDNTMVSLKLLSDGNYGLVNARERELTITAPSLAQTELLVFTFEALRSDVLFEEVADIT